ncbi:hypothetical protein K8942_04735 [Candidatus Peribacteria bacterium]|nr:MAG: hypothetical protein K8942_04735 [Candidatus Peribacteria bacterium]
MSETLLIIEEENQTRLKPVFPFDVVEGTYHAIVDILDLTEGEDAIFESVRTGNKTVSI